MRELPLRRRQLHVRLVTDVGEKPQDPPSIGKRKALCQLALASPKTSAPAGWTAPSRKIVKTKPAGLPKVEKLSKPLRECSQREKKSFLATGWPASPEKKVPTRTGWPAHARKKVFQPPAGQPGQEKKFFGHRLRSQPAKKSANPQRLASPRGKKSFGATGRTPRAKKTIFEVRAKQPDRQRQFFKSGPSAHSA